MEGTSARLQWFRCANHPETKGTARAPLRQSVCSSGEANYDQPIIK